MFFYKNMRTKKTAPLFAELFFQDVKARILGNSIAERNCPYVIGLLRTEQMFANVYSVWYNSYRDVLKGIL